MKQSQGVLSSYNELVRKEFKMGSNYYCKGDTKKAEAQREEFYDWLEKVVTKTESGYILYIPAERTFSRKQEKIEFKTIPRESFAYKLRMTK